MLDLAEVLDEQGDVTVKEGDVIEARVVEVGDKSDHVVLRRLLRRGPEARAELQQAFELGIPVEGTVSGVNKGGLDVNVAGVRGFCPISQLELRSVDAEAVPGYIGRKLDLQGHPPRGRPPRRQPGAVPAGPAGGGGPDPRRRDARRRSRSARW